MGLFDPDTTTTSTDPVTQEQTQTTTPGDVSDLAYGLDSHAAQAGDPSLFDSASDVVTKGIPLTGLSIVNSFANTGIELGNVFGANLDKWSIQAEAPAVEQATGQQGLDDYYQEHKQGIDLAGLAVGSLIPGLAGVKVYKAGTAAIDAARALTEGGEASSILARATGLLPSVQQSKIISEATESITDADSLFNGLTAEKYKAIAYGFGDQFLQSLAYETATAATMKASPIMDDASFSDVTQNIIQGALLGAGIGGVIEGIGVRSIFNKMIQTADDATKAQQIFNKLGMGNYEAGDQVNTVIHSIYSMPTPTSGLGRVYQKLTGDAATLAAKKALGTLVEPGDEELTNGMFDIVTRMKNEGQLTEDQAYQQFARLAKVQRVTSDVIPDIDDGSFYINKRASQSGQNSLNFNDLVSSDSGPASDLTLRYQLKPGSIAAVTAKHDDTFFDVAGNPQPLYKNSEDAFNQGVDMFVNPKGDIIVNPSAPNIQQIPKPGESRTLNQAEELAFRTTGNLPPESKPLLGSKIDIGDKPGATILNVQTGSITDSAIPTVGDHGNLVYKRDGLAYGQDGKFSPQSIDSPITGDTATVDASARYAWMNNRGIKPGDAITSDDIPAMETLYQHLTSADQGIYSSNVEALNKTKVTFDGDELSSNPSDLLEAIRDAKTEQIKEDISGEMNAEEAAMRANVPQDFIKNGFQAPNGPGDYILPPSAHNELQHVQLWYDIGNLNMQDGNIIRGIQDTQYRVQLIKAANQDAHAAFFGQDADNFLINSKSSDASLVGGPGPGFLKISSSDYAKSGQEYERVGRFNQQKNQNDMLAVNQALGPSANALRDDLDASAEAGMFRAVRQRSGGNTYSFLPDELQSKYMPDTPDGHKVAVLTGSLMKDETGKIVDWNKQFIPKNFVDASRISSNELSSTTSGLRNYYTLSPKVADWEQANQVLNDQRIVQRNNFFAANGIQKNWDTGTLYTPPINTGKYPYFAYVKARPGTGMADDSVGVITAQSQAELQSKIAQLADQYSIYTKTGETSLKTYHEVEGDYQYNRNFANNRVQNDLANKGILNDVFPETRGQNIIQDYLDWHGRQVIGLNRDYTELGNAQLFAELRSMGDLYTSTGTGKVGYVSTALERQTANPYQQYINTALNISPKEQYRTWAFANEKLESLFSTAFDALKTGFRSARAGVIPLEKASDLAESYGLGKIYENAVSPLKAYYNIANKLPDSKSLSTFVGGANSILSNGIIRLDGYQSLIHALTTPMLAAVEATSAKSQILKGLTTTALPDGSGRTIPATSKLIFNAVKNFWDDDIQAKWGDTYNSLGADKTVIGIQRQMMNELALPYGSFSQSGMLKSISKASDLGAKLSGSDFTNTFNHFISADVGRQLFEAAGFTGKDLTDQIMTFTNRVQGNFIAGQRPVAFQGPLGQAVGLFQTFGLNMLQNLFRYVENGEGKTLALLGGLQTTLFGLQGMPGFNFINQHLVGNAVGNTSHNDLYSGIASGLGAGKGSLGDYLLYGVTSNWLDANLYSRGDISPRNLTILPVNPLDYPAIRGGINIVRNLLNTSEKIANGASIPASLMLGLEHNGLSRPLAGLAQIAQGFSTNNNGQLISANQGVNGNSELFSMANFSRLLGARPLDEAANMGALQRLGVYTAKDEARVNAIGNAAKTELYKNGDLAPDEVADFAQRYSAAGGNQNKFVSTMARWAQEANAATQNKVFNSLRQSGGTNNAQVEMGGRQIPDYRNSGSTAVNSANSLTGSQLGQ